LPYAFLICGEQKRGGHRTIAVDLAVKDRIDERGQGVRSDMGADAVTVIPAACMAVEWPSRRNHPGSNP